MDLSHDKSVKIEISQRTIIFVLGLLVAFKFLTMISDILLTFFVSLLIMAILNPLVTNLAKYKIPRPLSVIVVYILVFFAVVVSFAALIPPLVTQTSTFVTHVPTYIYDLGVPTQYTDQILPEIIAQLGAIPAQLAQFTLSLLSNVLEVIAVLVFAFYLLMMREHLDDHLAPFFSDIKKNQIDKIIDLLEFRLGGWARGQILLMVAIACVTYIGLLLLGIPYALPLAIFAGFLELIPYVGPFIAAIPAIFIGFSISPFLGFAAAALAFLIQELENYILVPKIMQKSAGVNPLVTLIALGVGFNLAGIVGLLISVPCAITLEVLARELYFKKDENKASI
jgi:predicted PurR-regulated permease PerM